MSLNPIEELFEAILKEIHENDNKLSDKVIENLISLFHLDFVESIQFIDEKCISLLKTSNNRQIFQIESNDKKSKTKPNRYYCLIDTNYCSCGAFRKGLLMDSLMFCKHLIASKLSNAMKSYKIVEKSDAEMDRFWTKHIMN